MNPTSDNPEYGHQRHGLLLHWLSEPEVFKQSGIVRAVYLPWLENHSPPPAIAVRPPQRMRRDPIATGGSYDAITST
jgi:hypothetical protein